MNSFSETRGERSNRKIVNIGSTPIVSDNTQQQEE
jgi:hypothetical protein